MAQKLTLALLKGASHTETIVLKDTTGAEFEVDVRPLKHTEQAEIQGMLVKGMKQKAKSIGKKQISAGELELDYEMYVKNQYESKLHAVSLALVDPKLSKEEVNEHFTSEWIDQVADKVFEMSGIELGAKDGNEEIETFREE